jgi:hypothetical protein
MRATRAAFVRRLADYSPRANPVTADAPSTVLNRAIAASFTIAAMGHEHASARLMSGASANSGSPRMLPGWSSCSTGAKSSWGVAMMATGRHNAIARRSQFCNDDNRPAEHLGRVLDAAHQIDRGADDVKSSRSAAPILPQWTVPTCSATTMSSGGSSCISEWRARLLPKLLEFGRRLIPIDGSRTTRATASSRRQPARRIFSCPQTRPTTEKPRNLFMDP